MRDRRAIQDVLTGGERRPGRMSAYLGYTNGSRWRAKVTLQTQECRGARNGNQTEDRRHESVSGPSEEARRAARWQWLRPSARAKRHLRHTARRPRKARTTPPNSHRDARRPGKIEEVQAEAPASRSDFQAARCAAGGIGLGPSSRWLA